MIPDARKDYDAWRAKYDKIDHDLAVIRVAIIIFSALAVLSIVLTACEIVGGAL